MFLQQQIGQLNDIVLTNHPSETLPA